MQTIAVANHKGGVGKTATVHALGVALAERGEHVLLLDLDPQSSLTGACGVRDAAGRSLAEVLGGATPGHLGLADVIMELGPNLWLAPGDIALAISQLGLTSRIGRENVLMRILATVSDRYDVALLDTAPSLGLLAVNALTAADAVLIPTLPQAADLRGLRLFLDTVELVCEALNPNLETLGILITFLDCRLIHHRQALEAMKAGGLPLLKTRIGRSVRVAEAAGLGETVLTYAPRNPQARAYQDLATEVQAWLENARR